MRAQRPSDPPFSDAPKRTLLGALPIAPQAMRSMPLPPPPVSGELVRVPMMEPEPAVATVKQPEPRRMGNWTILLLLFVAAAAAGAVVYFGLPYVQ